MKKDIINKLSNKVYSQKDLWKYGVSGDIPIVLVKVKEENDIYTVKEILKTVFFSLPVFLPHCMCLSCIF